MGRELKSNFNLKVQAFALRNRQYKNGHDFQCIDTDNGKSITILIIGSTHELTLEKFPKNKKKLLKKFIIMKNSHEYFNFQHVPAWKPGLDGNDIDGPKSVFSSITINKEIIQTLDKEQLKQNLIDLLDCYFAENLKDKEILKYPDQKITSGFIKQVRKEYLNQIQEKDPEDVKKELFGLSCPRCNSDEKFHCAYANATEVISRLHTVANKVADKIYRIEQSPSSNLTDASNSLPNIRTLFRS